MNRDELWTQIRQGLKDGIHYTVQKTEELTRIGRIKLEIASQKRRLARLFGELGARSFALLTQEGDAAEDLRLDERLIELKDRLLEEEQRLDALLADLAAARAASTKDEGETESAEQVTIRVEDVEDELFFNSKTTGAGTPADEGGDAGKPVS